MKNISRDIAIKKITEMSTDQVSKVLIFMAGMEAEHTILEKNNELFFESPRSCIDSHTFSRTCSYEE